MDIKKIMDYAIEQNASDIHLSVNQLVVMRINGTLIPRSEAELTKEQMSNVLETIMTKQQLEQYFQNSDIDFTYDYKIRLRINIFDTISGTACSIRLLSNNIPLLKNLGSNQALEKLTTLTSGIIFITGPTGSGKTTTMASIVDHINTTQHKHILTIEDPVEYLHKSNKSLINQREVGTNCKSFPGALRSSLREDPDILIIGELRDKESMLLALNAAETGHLVISTIHSSSAAQTFNRIIGSFTADEQPMIRSMLASSFEAAITQRLAQKKDGSGRVAAFEILLAHPGVRHLIRENKIPQIYSLMQTNSRMGMKVMHDSVSDLLNREVISKREFNALMNFNNLPATGEQVVDSRKWN